MTGPRLGQSGVLPTDYSSTCPATGNVSTRIRFRRPGAFGLMCILDVGESEVWREILFLLVLMKSEGVSSTVVEPEVASKSSTLVEIVADASSLG